MIILKFLIVSLVGFPLLLVCSLLLTYSLYLHYVHIKYRHIPGPKRTSFFSGNVADVMKTIQEGRLMSDICREWSKEHGPVFVVFFFHRHNVIVYIPEVIRDILVLDNYPKDSYVYKPLEQQFGQRLMGSGLVTEIDHETWKPMSALFSPTFHRNYLKTCIVQFNASCDLLLDNLHEKADGKTEVNMMEMFNRVSLDSISKVAFGLELNVFDPVEPQFVTDLKFLLQSMLAYFNQLFLWLSPLRSDVKLRRRARQAAKNMRKIGQQCITAQMEALQRGEKLDNNILSHILQSTSAEDPSITDIEKMIDHFVTFFLAGQETTACLMVSTLLEIAQHPEIAYKMKTEVDAVIGDDGYVSFEDLSKLKYTTAVLKESLRLHPPVPTVQRILSKDVVWNGIKIPTGASITVSIMNMGRLEEYFGNPEEFMPSRFLGDDRYNNVYIPFSLGPRKCIGQQFAMIEARVIMAKLVKYFTFDLVPGQSLSYVKTVTCKPKDNCLVYVKPVFPKSDTLTNID